MQRHHTVSVVVLQLVRWGLILFVMLLALLIWATGVVGLPRQTGYLSPIFSPDGQSVYAVRRDVRSFVTGPGWEFFTTPATSRIQRDRFTLISIHMADGRTTAIEELPPSPLEGETIRAYHGAIFGSTAAHLRWADPTHLEYEVSVTRTEIPASRSFVFRKRWDPKRGDIVTSAWQPGTTGFGGDEPLQLYGDLEVIAPPGTEGMPCAIVLLRKGDAQARPLVATSTCASKYRSGYSPTVLGLLIRREAIERGELVRNTRAQLVERGRRAGLSEYEAEMAAIDEMERLGLYPKSTKLVAGPAACAQASRLFEISDEELTVGLFQDIERAIASPGKEVNFWGTYHRYRGYETSQLINEYVAAGNSSFFVRIHAACWKLTIRK